MFTRQGRRPHLSVTLGLGTLAGLDNLPGSLAGFGAIPAGLARSIAASAATINALITDPDTGRVTAAGALTYRPTQELRDQIAAILNVCQFPSCRQPVWRCDMDHREEFNHQSSRTGRENRPRKSRPPVQTASPDQAPFRLANPDRPEPVCSRIHQPHRTPLPQTGQAGRRTRIWVSTAATAIAERLDNIAATAEVNRPAHPAKRRRRTPHNHPDPPRPDHKADGIPAQRHSLGPHHRAMERPTTLLIREPAVVRSLQ